MDIIFFGFYATENYVEYHKKTSYFSKQTLYFKRSERRTYFITGAPRGKFFAQSTKKRENHRKGFPLEIPNSFRHFVTKMHLFRETEIRFALTRMLENASPNEKTPELSTFNFNFFHLSVFSTKYKKMIGKKCKHYINW